MTSAYNHQLHKIHWFRSHVLRAFIIYSVHEGSLYFELGGRYLDIVIYDWGVGWVDNVDKERVNEIMKERERGGG